jgi:hypothetical protein
MAVPCPACPIFLWYGETCESQNRPAWGWGADPQELEVSQLRES